MRFHLLDKLICPRCGTFPLRLNAEELLQSEHPSIRNLSSPCSLHCGYTGKSINQVSSSLPCSACFSTRIIRGKLSCSSCGADYPIEDGIPNFILEEQMITWVNEEKEWWEKNYRMQRVSSLIKSIERIRSRVQGGQGIPGNRWYERDRYLFSSLRQNELQGTFILEIGCGTSQYVAGLLSPNDYGFWYIGTDVSREALKVASSLLPEGEFVQCTADKLPFRSEICSYALCLGVLHHLPDWEATLSKIIHLIKPTGLFLFDEAIDKPRVLGKYRKQSLTAYKDSPHEGEISLKKLISILSSYGKVVYHLKMTPLRVLGVWIFGNLMNRSLLMTRSILLLDQVFLKSAGRLFKSLSAGEVIGILKRK